MTISQDIMVLVEYQRENGQVPSRIARRALGWTRTRYQAAARAIDPGARYSQLCLTADNMSMFMKSFRAHEGETDDPSLLSPPAMLALAFMAWRAGSLGQPYGWVYLDGRTPLVKFMGSGKAADAALSELRRKRVISLDLGPNGIEATKLQLDPRQICRSS